MAGRSSTSLASSVGDVVFVAIAQRLHERPATADGEPSTLAAGWRRIVDAVVVG